MSLFVIGMHRSGTSMLTGLLHLAGAHVGDKGGLTGPNEANRKGFWEQNRIRKISESLLHSAGADWDRPLKFDPDTVDPGLLETISERAGEALRMFDGHAVWVVKDPRFCVTLPFWRRIVPDLTAVLVLRNPLEVARSLFRRNSIPVPIGLALWEHYVLNSVQHSVGLARVIVQHQDLVYETRAELIRIAGELAESGLGELVIAAEASITEFIDPALYRSRSSTSELDEFLVPAQREVWEAARQGDLRALKDRTLSPASHAALEGYEALDAAFSRVKQLERRLQLKLRQIQDPVPVASGGNQSGGAGSNGRSE